MVEKNGKKICIAIHGLAHAGAERVAASWANYLTENGYMVSIIVYANTEDTYDLDMRVKILPIADTENAYFQMSKVKRLLRIRRMIQREKPQILISFLPRMQISIMLATWGMRFKRIETVRNNPWVDTDVEKNRTLWNLCFHRSDAIIVQNREQASYFPEKLHDKCVVISNPISGDFVDRKKEYTDQPIRRFVAVARINTQKNYPMMVQAFVKAIDGNQDCTLDIYGAGSQEFVQNLQEQINQLGMEKRIQLCGWRRDISEILPSYDAFLMSSNYEGMPNALAEAMACGLVCLSTDCKTGPKDMIDPGVNGFLAKTGDSDSFAEEIQKILRMNWQQCAEMGAAAREKILNMCSEKNTLERLRCLVETEV